MPIHMGFRDKVRVGIGVVKMGIIGMNMGGVRTHVAPGDIIAAAKGIKHRQRVTTCDNYQDFQSQVNARQNQFTPAGWTELQHRMPSIQGYLGLNNGSQLHLITHNSDSGRMKRIEIETPTGNTLVAWTDS
jgi:hypothetical protein